MISADNLMYFPYAFPQELMGGFFIFVWQYLGLEGGHIDHALGSRMSIRHRLLKVDSLPRQEGLVLR